MVRGHQRRDNVLLILTTEGGDADAAYRISRVFQDSYSKFTAFIPGWCKSAGTLCALGASELVISDCGELGPLDVQLRRRDELGQYNSGLDVTESLRQVREQTFEAFESYMLDIIQRSYKAVSFKLASELAAKMAVQLYEPLCRQIDPLQVGEQARAMSVARSYGDRLLLRGQNVKDGMLQLLIESYPSHGFVIDRHEASLIFEAVREPTVAEQELADALGAAATIPSQTPVIKYVSSEQVIEDEQSESVPAQSAGTRRQSQRSRRKVADAVSINERPS